MYYASGKFLGNILFSSLYDQILLSSLPWTSGISCGISCGIFGSQKDIGEYQAARSPLHFPGIYSGSLCTEPFSLSHPACLTPITGVGPEDRSPFLVSHTYHCKRLSPWHLLSARTLTLDSYTLT